MQNDIAPTFVKSFNEELLNDSFDYFNVLLTYQAKILLSRLQNDFPPPARGFHQGIIWLNGYSLILEIIY